MKRLLGILLLGLGALSMVAVSSAVQGGGPSPIAVKLTPSDGAAEDLFGISVSIDGGRAVVGANSKGAYLFERDATGAWVEVQKLIPPAGSVTFGRHVSIDGDRVIVGAGNNASYVFERQATGTWVEVQKLTPSDGGDRFGNSVSIDGDRAIVGATGADRFLGAAYVFERDATGAWVEVGKLTASDRAGGRFGNWVSIDGDRAIVTAPTDDGLATRSGAAYAFERNATGAWVEVGKLTASDGSFDDRFGVAVSIDGDHAIIGAFFAGSFGAAYAFERDATGAWVEVQKLTASDGAAGDLFGFPVSIDGDRVILGARKDDDLGSLSGSAYVFQRDAAGAWLEVAKLTAPDGVANDEFGVSVSIDGNQAIVGAYLDEVRRNVDSGSAYVFDVEAAILIGQVGSCIELVEALIADGTLNNGQGNALLRPLQDAQKFLTRGQDIAAMSQLLAFVNTVNDYIDAQKLTQQQGQPLIDCALAIVDQIMAGG